MSDPIHPNAIAASVIGLVAGGLVAAVVWIALRATFDQPLFLRKNHRGRQVPVAAGIVLFLAVVVVTGVWWFIDVAAGWLDFGSNARTSMVLIAGGFGLLGLFDDLAGSGDDRGFAGHLGALVHGRLTTGGVKLLGGGLLALVVVPLAGYSWWRLLLGAAVIALAANTANLFDRAPARCIKVIVLCAIVLVATRWNTEFSGLILAGPAVVVGAGLGLAYFDAREQLMLGDAGSNVLGAALGWALIATTNTTAAGPAPTANTGWIPQVAVLVVLIALNVASEKVSFSKVIDDTPALRAIDRFGRPDPEVQ